MKTLLINVLAALFLFLVPSLNYGQVPDLGAASSFALFSSAGAFNNLGPTLVTGDIGTNAGAFTGFPPGTVTGQIHVADAISFQAATDLGLAYGSLSAVTCGAVIGTTLGNGQVLTPSVYCTGAATTLNGVLTLDGEDNPGAIFIFKIDGAFSTSTYTSIVMINGASLCNVYWHVNGAFTLGDYSIFRGNIIANGQIELLEGSTLLGRGLTQAGAILLHNNLVNIGLQPAAPVTTLVQPTCALQTGSITVTSPTGLGITYSIGGAFQSSTTFGNLTVGDYTVTVKGSEGCNSAGTIVTINAAPYPPAAPAATLTQPTCVLTTGTIAVTSPIGATIEYSKDGINWQSSTTFSNLPAGFTYSIRVRDTAGDPSCISSADFVIDAVPNAPAAPLATLTHPTCVLITGTIVVTSPIGATIEYSKDGINWQSSTTFSNLPVGFTYTISVRDTAGDPSCISSADFVINAVPNAPAAPAATLTQPTCVLISGTIVVTSPIGATIEYSKDGINWQSSTAFSNLPAGFTYTIRVRDTAGDPSCNSSADFVINAVPNAPAAPLATLTQPTCVLITGTIVVTSPIGATIEYSKDDLNWQSGTTFNTLPAGFTYTIRVRDTAGDPSCISSADFVVNAVPNAPAAPLATITQPTCVLITGTIVVTSPIGATIEYSKDGINWQSSTILSNLPAGFTYTIRVRDTAGDPSCISSADFVINAVPNAPASPLAIVTQPACVLNTGTIVVTSPIGATIEYSKDGINWQSSSTFNNLPAGFTYTIRVRDTAGDPSCISSADFVINAVPNAPAAPLTTLTQPTCVINTGTILVTSPIGNTIEYSRDGLNWQSSTTFGNVPAGFTYTIRVRDTAGDPSCISSADFVINAVPNAPAVPLASLAQPTCVLITGTIVVTSPIGATIEYSKDGLNWQSSTTFSSLPAGFTYTIRVRDTAGDPSCVSSADFVINAVPNAPAAPLATLTQPTCLLVTGTIVVTSPIGATIEYSKDGINWQSSTIFSNLPAGFTYTIRVRDTAGDPSCVSSADFVINTVPNAPAAPAATLTQPTCVLTTGTIVVTSPIGATIEYSKDGINWQSSTTFSNLTAGFTYTIRVRDTAGDPSCVSMSDFGINPVPNPPAEPMANVTQPTCVLITGTIVVTSPIGATIEYSKDGINWQSSTTFSNLPAGFTYTIRVRDTAGDPSCVSMSDFVVNAVPIAPTASTEVISDVNCFGGDNGSAHVTALGGAGGYLYEWSTIPVQTSATVTNLSAGLYFVTVTDAIGCSTTASVVIDEPLEALLVELSQTNVSCYGGNDGSATAIASGGTTPYTYLWSNAQTTATATSLMAGNYSVTVTDANLCTNSGSLTIIQPNEVTVDAGDNQYLCQQNITVLTGNWPESGSVGNWTLVSKPAGSPAITIFPANSPIATVVGLQPNETVPYIFRYTITTTYPGGIICTVFDEMQVLDQHYPSLPYAGPDQKLCLDTLAPYFTLSANTPMYGSGVWSQVPGGPLAVIDDIYNPNTEVTYTTVGTYAFLWTVNNGVCMPNEPNQDTVVVRVYALPAVFACEDIEICSGSPVILDCATATSECMIFVWSSNGSGTFNNINILNPIYIPSAIDIANGYVVLTIFGYLGPCSPCGPAILSDSVLITIYPGPIVDVTVGSVAGCFGSATGSLTAAVTSGSPPYDYLWSDGQTTATAVNLIAGLYWVTVTDQHGCIGIDSASIGQPSQIILSGIPSVIDCYSYLDGEVNLTVSGGTPPYSFLWSNGVTTEDITGIAAGIYSVTVTDANLCQASGSWTVAEPPAWTIGILGDVSVCCKTSSPSDLYTYTATISGAYGPPVTYEWVVEGGTIESGQNSSTITVRWSCCENGKVWLTVNQGPVPCTLTTFINVVIYPTPAPIITGPAQVTAGEDSTVYCTTFVPGHLYTWSVVGGVITSGMGTNCITVAWGPYPACGCGNVTVWETANGCTGTDIQHVSLIPNENVSISGYASYDNDYETRMNGIKVQLKYPDGTIAGTTYTKNNLVSGEPGYFVFTDLANGTYSLHGTYTGLWGGNNATDALIVQLNALGAFPLFFLRDSVADVNGSLTVSALDALYIKLRTVGTISSYPAGDWKVTDTTVDFQGTALIVNLKVLSVGDVNGSYIPTGLKETPSISVLEDGILNNPVGKSFTYNIRSNADAELGAMTLFLTYDQNRYEVSEITSPFDDMKYEYGAGKVTIAWSDSKAVKVAPQDIIMNIVMKAKVKITVPETVFTINPGSEFANIAAQPYEDFRLRMPVFATSDVSQDVTVTNYPNPFISNTVIAYSLPESGNATLVMNDLYGNEICVLVDQAHQAGSYEINVNAAALHLSPGIYFIRLTFAGATKTQVKVNKIVITR